MSQKIYIGISRREIEQEIEKIIRSHVKALVTYDKVKDVFYNELRRFAISKVKKMLKFKRKKIPRMKPKLNKYKHLQGNKCLEDSGFPKKVI